MLLLLLRAGLYALQQRVAGSMHEMAFAAEIFVHSSYCFSSPQRRVIWSNLLLLASFGQLSDSAIILNLLYINHE